MAEIVLRDPREDDAEPLLAWRNDPATRAASRATHEVSPDEHRRWLAGLLADPDRHLWIAEADGRPVGQVRFDRVRGYDYEISVSVDPAVRGAGIGTAAIRAGCERLWRRTNARRVLAAVRAGNDASARAFTAAGFRREDAGDDGLERFTLPRPEEWAPGRRSTPAA